MVKLKVWLRIFMKKINYLNKEVKEQIKYLKQVNAVSVVLNELVLKYDNITITDVNEDAFAYNISFKTTAYNMAATINRIYRTLDIACEALPYISKYYIDDNSCVLKGKEYKNNERKVFQNSENNSVNHVFKYQNKSDLFDISIMNSHDLVNEDLIVSILLCLNLEDGKVKEILDALCKYIDFQNSELKIRKNDGSNLIIYMGTLTKYVEYQKFDDHDEKIYLENGTFLKEVTEREKIDDVIPYVKKIGKKEK